MDRYEKIGEFKKLWEEGLKSDDIARKLGISEDQVLKYAIAAGVLPKKIFKPIRNRKVTPQVLIYMRDMLLDGASLTEIADYFGLDRTTVRNHLRAIGLLPRRADRIRKKVKISKKELEEMSKKGYSDREIAEHFGVSPSYIAMLRRRYGIYKKYPVGMREFKRLETIADTVMEKIYEKCYTTNKELRQLGIDLDLDLARRLEDFIEGLKWFRISRVSTRKHRVFSRSLSKIIILYVDGCEKEVASFLVSRANCVPRRAIDYLLRKNYVPHYVIRTFYLLYRC